MRHRRRLDVEDAQGPDLVASAHERSHPVELPCSSPSRGVRVPVAPCGPPRQCRVSAERRPAVASCGGGWPGIDRGPRAGTPLSTPRHGGSHVRQSGDTDPLHLLAAVAAGLFVLFVLTGTRFIPNDRMGVVEKRWSGRGSVKGGLIALRGEAGFQPSILRGGLHADAAAVPRARHAARHDLRRDASATSSRATARRSRRRRRSPRTERRRTSRTSAHFLERRPARPAAQDPARGHVRHQPRPVRRRHRRTRSIYLRSNQDEDDCPPDGGGHRRARRLRARRHQGRRRPRRHRDRPRRPGLPQGEIIAPVCGDDPTRPRRPTTTTSRTRSGSSPPAGARGRQLQVLVEGTYYMNRLFATVETIPKTVIEVGTVGVVVSYTGARGADLSGDDVQARRARGERARAACGASRSCPASTRSTRTPARSCMVPTTNFILKWNRSRGRLAPLRREPVRGLAHHQGRLRAAPAALGRRAHRLQEGAARHPALRRHQAPRRADARPDGRAPTSRTSARRARSSSSFRSAATSSSAPAPR